MEEKRLDAQESIELITRMIRNTAGGSNAIRDARTSSGATRPSSSRCSTTH